MSPQERARLAGFSDEPGSRDAQTNRSLFKALAQIGIINKPDRLAFAKVYGIELDSYAKLTERGAQTLLSAANAIIDGEE